MTSLTASGLPASRRKPAGHAALIAVAVIALAVGAALPWLVPTKIAMSLLAQAMFDALLATSVGFLILQNGRTSFGQAAFFGAGFVFWYWEHQRERAAQAACTGH